MHKLCAKWVPRELKIDQKQQHLDDSEQCLDLFGMWQWMKHGSITAPQSQNGNHLSGLSVMNWQGYLGCTRNNFYGPSSQGANHQQRLLYRTIREFEGRNCRKMASLEEKYLCFIIKMHHVPNRRKRSLKYNNWASNCFSTPHIPQVTIFCFQTFKECSLERNSGLMRKLLPEQRPILNRKNGIEKLNDRYNPYNSPRRQLGQIII